MTNTITTATTTIAIDRTPGALTPRAQAVLCAVRIAPRTLVGLRNATGDSTNFVVESLLDCMAADGLVAKSGNVWGPTYDGIAWLETNGLAVATTSKEFASKLWAAEQEAAKS